MSCRGSRSAPRVFNELLVLPPVDPAPERVCVMFAPSGELWSPRRSGAAHVAPRVSVRATAFNELLVLPPVDPAPERVCVMFAPSGSA